MAIVFQYGSNMSTARLNDPGRLAGDAKFIGVARTSAPYNLAFTVWSKGNSCAAADLVPSDVGRAIYGVMYDIPDFLISRDTAKAKSRKSMDQIEGEGGNYERVEIDLITNDSMVVRAITYLVRDRKPNLKTSFAYAQHILNGIREHGMPEEYFSYALDQILTNNPALGDPLRERYGNA